MGNAMRWAVVAGLVAGALDILYAITYWAIARDVPAARILQSVASGLLGKSSFDGGAATAALGLALHFLMTLAMAAIYFTAARRLPVLWQRPLAAGATYGVLVYVVMNFVVVPLSAAATGAPGNNLWTWLSVAMHALLVGIPIALCARQAFRPSPGAGPRPSARTA